MSVRSWVADRARPFPADPLPVVLRDAQIVGVASAVRSARESVEATHTLVMGLIDAGFRAVMIEGVDAVAAPLDHHVHTGGGDPAALLACGQAFARTAEHRELVGSLRAWNREHPDDPVSVVHTDGELPGALPAIERGLAERDLAWHRRTGQRVVHCGGTAHVIAGDPRTVPPGQTHPNAGGLLRRALGLGYAAVALTVGSGRAPFDLPPPASDFLEATFSDLGEPVLLDLAAARADPATPAEVRAWLAAPLRTRMIGPTYDASRDGDARVDAGPVADAIDVVVHLPSITPARLLPAVAG